MGLPHSDSLLQSLLDQSRHTHPPLPGIFGKLPFQRGERRTHSVLLIRQSGYVYFAAAARQNPLPAVLAVAGQRPMNPVIGRQIASTDLPSGVVNVQRIERSALTPRALLQLAPVAGKVAAHMPDTV